MNLNKPLRDPSSAKKDRARLAWQRGLLRSGLIFAQKYSRSSAIELGIVHGCGTSEYLPFLVGFWLMLRMIPSPSSSLDLAVAELVRIRVFLKSGDFGYAKTKRWAAPGHRA
jgi:hypothetical protein